MDYDIGEMAAVSGKLKGVEAELRPIRPRLSDERLMYSIMKRILTELSNSVRDTVLPLYQQQRSSGTLLDAAMNDIDASAFDFINSSKDAWIRRAVSSLFPLFTTVGDRHTKEFGDTIKSAIGVDMSAILKRDDIAPLIRTSIAYSSSLVTNMTDDAIRRIENVVYSGALNGTSVADLRKQLKVQLGISDRRAKLIARDQMEKFNGNLNKIRQQQAGVSEYKWLTAGDGRVRQDHADRNGRTYRWDDPPSDGNPGEPINCRCVAVAIVKFD